MSKEKGVVVQNAEDFANIASKLVPKTSIFYVQERKDQQLVEKMTPWEQVMPVPDISQYHIIISWNKEGNKYMKENALSKKICGDSKWEMVTSKSDIVKGDWVLVNYDNKKYPRSYTNS